MPRKPRDFYSTNFYHIMVQGIEKKNIFDNNKYKEKYIQLIKENKKIYKITILSLCVMINHAHIVIHCENNESMSKFMKSINTSYANYYNKVEERVGYVFRDRFLSEPIFDDRYLHNCIAYVHNNPVKAGLVKRREDYKYSSYNSYYKLDDIINEQSIKLVFGDNENYIKNYEEMNKNNQDKFLDVNEDFLNPNDVITSFYDKFNIDQRDIFLNNEWLKKLVNELTIKCGLSIRKICEIIKVDRTRVRNVLKNT